MNINEIELASELAHERLVNEVKNNLIDNEDELYNISEDGETYLYKEVYQGMFNDWYDYYLEMIERAKI